MEQDTASGVLRPPGTLCRTHRKRRTRPGGGGSVSDDVLMSAVTSGVVGDPVDLLLLHAVYPDHVPAHGVGHAERLLADWTLRLPGVHLQVGVQTAEVGVAVSAEGTDVASAICGGNRAMR